jgi:hypothetical protein
MRNNTTELNHNEVKIIGNRLLFRRIGILVVVFCGWLLFAPRTVAPQYSRFLHQNTDYYSEFGHACDVVLAVNPLGTNVHRVIPLDSVSLPKIIRDLSPQKIDVESNYLWIQWGSDMRMASELSGKKKNAPITGC